MKRLFPFVWMAAASALSAQTLSLYVGRAAYDFPTAAVGEMSFMGDESLTVLDCAFLLGEVDSVVVGTPPAETTAVVRLSYGAADSGLTVSPNQTAEPRKPFTETSNSRLWDTSLSGITLRFGLRGIHKIVLESVDGLPISGSADQYITTFAAPDGTTLTPGLDYYIATFPCDLYGGYRLSIYRDSLVAHYFAVHQTAEAGSWLAPADLVESELEFVDPEAPLVEEERPGLNTATKNALVAYQKNPTEANKQALLGQMGIRYDKVVARKKSKLRELEREAHHQSLIDEMQDIVDEMVTNRDIRIEQQFLRLIDPREDDDPSDAWMVLRGASAPNAYVAYAPLTNAEYAAYRPDYTFAEGLERWPVVNITVADAEAYARWLSEADTAHTYRLPTEEEWILAAGHMPKDVLMNADHVETGLTAVDAYAQTTGACGGIDFWGNCWEWTTTTNAAGLCVVKGGSWDSSRDACRSEYSDDVRNPSQGYANVGVRLVREDR